MAEESEKGPSERGLEHKWRYHSDMKKKCLEKNGVVTVSKPAEKSHKASRKMALNLAVGSPAFQRWVSRERTVKRQGLKPTQRMGLEEVEI